MNSELAAAERLAGWLYLVVVVTGVFCLMVVPSQVPLRMHEAAPVLLARVAAQETLWRWGIAAFVLNQIAFALLPLALWQRLHAAGPRAAAAMVGLAVVGVPVALVALTGRLQLLLLAGDAAPTMTVDAQQAAVTAALGVWRHGLWLAQWFWGLWLAPLGWLLWRTRAVSRVLAACTVAGCVGYLVMLMLPLLARTDAPDWVTLPAAVGEIGTCLWLLGRGLRYGRGDRYPISAHW